jgi:hypothetical protein
MSPGYVPEAVQARVRAQAGHRCGYCLSRQQLVLGLLEIEHIIMVTSQQYTTGSRTFHATLQHVYNVKV